MIEKKVQAQAKAQVKEEKNRQVAEGRSEQ